MNGKGYDIAIVGGGASGLCAAAYISKYAKNLNVALIEKEQRTGRRLLATGNGRCNMTNLNLSSKNYRGTGAKYIDGLLSRYSPDALLEEFKKFGLITRPDSAGRVYPYSGQASSVLDILREYTSTCEITGVKITDIKKSGDYFILSGSDIKITAKRVILACGGYVQPSLGADSSGYTLAKKLGHKSEKNFPSLAPVIVKSEYLSALKGIRVQCCASLFYKGKKVLSENGELQFSDNALSGICIFQLSPYVNKYLSNGDRDMYISVNLMPEYGTSDIVKLLNDRKNANGDCTLENFLGGMLNKRIGQTILKTLDIKPLSKPCKSLDKAQTEKIAELIADMRFYPCKQSDIKKAQVSAGGVSGDEINFSDMSSKLIKGLYFAGEMTDVDGDCGGYNLHFAFSSGITAAKSCIKELTQND